MIRVRLFEHVHRSTAPGTSGIKALVRGIIHQVVNPAIDGKCLKLLSVLRVKHDDLAGAAADKQPMMRFIERNCESTLFGQRNGPTCRDGAALSVDHLDLVLSYVVEIQPLTGWLDNHGIE